MRVYVAVGAVGVLFSSSLNHAVRDDSGVRSKASKNKVFLPIVVNPLSRVQFARRRRTEDVVCVRTLGIVDTLRPGSGKSREQAGKKSPCQQLAERRPIN